MVGRFGAVLAQWVCLSRWREWAQSKLPYIGAATVLLTSRESSPLVALAIIGTILPWAALGYGINEIADRKCDQQAGKPNRAAGLSRTSLGLFLFMTAGLSFALSLLWAVDEAAPALVLAGLVLAAAYSLPPLRLKEGGIVGLIGAAAAQWVLPVLAVSAGQPWGWLRPSAWCLALLGLAIGMRWIAVHQLHDAPADRKAGVRTWASTGGRVWRVILGAFVCELALLAVTLVVTWPHSIPAIAGLVFWALPQIFIRARDGSIRNRLQDYDHAPLAAYYFLFLPVTLATARGLSSPAFFTIAAAFLILGWGHLRRILAEVTAP